MPQQIDFSQYETKAPPPSAIDFSKYEQKPAVTSTISNSRPGTEGNAFERFATRLTGIPIHRVLQDPNRYLNPFSRAYQENQEPAIRIPSPEEMASAPIHVPGSDLVHDVRTGNLAGAAGDVTPALLMAAPMFASRFAAMSPQVMPPRPALPAAPIELPGEVEASPAPAYSPTTRAERLGLLLPEKAGGKIPLPESSVEHVTADQNPVPVDQQVQQRINQERSNYPEGVQPRPTDRAEILDDKIAREKAANDMGMQLYRAKREIGQESAPVPKWQQVAQTQADLIRAEAETRAQQVLADAEKAATTSKALAKTTAAKAKIPAASDNPDLSNPETVMDLMQRSIDLARARKGK